MILWLVYDHCDCEEPSCYGRADIEVFSNEQTASQAAEQRSNRYGGSVGRPDMHMERVKVSTKTRGW